MASRTKKALVTGASSGIGLTFAERLAREGFALTLVARSQQKLDDLRAVLAGAANDAARHSVIAADLSSPEDVERIADEVRAGGYDLVINSAGVGSYGRFTDTALDRQLSMMHLNMTAVVTIAHAFLEKSKRGDALLNVSSTVGLLAFPGGAVYCATKAFVTSFSESLWGEMKERGVYVAALLPGVTRTNFHEASGGDPHRRPADNISQSPEQVVDAAMIALAKREAPTIIPGFANKAMLFSTRFIPRKAMVSMMGGLQAL